MKGEHVFCLSSFQPEKSNLQGESFTLAAITVWFLCFWKWRTSNKTIYPTIEAWRVISRRLMSLKGQETLDIECNSVPVWFRAIFMVPSEKKLQQTCPTLSCIFRSQWLCTPSGEDQQWCFRTHLGNNLKGYNGPIGNLQRLNICKIKSFIQEKHTIHI